MSQVKLRMGMHNRITIDRFAAIKDDINKGLPIAKIAKRHAVSDSTVRKVRRHRNFKEYRMEANAKYNQRHAPVVMSKTGQVPFEDFGKEGKIFSSKMLKPSEVARSDALDREGERTARGVGVLFLLVFIALVAVAIFAIVLITGGEK